MAALTSRRNLPFTTLGFAAMVLAAAALSAGRAHADEMSTGRFGPFATAAPGEPNADTYGRVDGEADLYRSDNGTTTAEVDVTGLDPGVTYPVHVHKMACANSDADGHYKADLSGSSEPPNEIWPGPVTADEDGEAVGQTTVDYTAGDDAQSMVVHDPSGAKLACADLASEQPDQAG